MENVGLIECCGYAVGAEKVENLNLISCGELKQEFNCFLEISMSKETFLGCIVVISKEQFEMFYALNGFWSF